MRIDSSPNQGQKQKDNVRKRPSHRVWYRAGSIGFMLLILIAAVSCVTEQSNPFQKQEAQFIGIPVAEEFLAFYEGNGGGHIFGNPLADAYIEPTAGRLVQYFQRLRLEYDQFEDKVVITPLGQWAMPDPAEQQTAPGSEAEPDSSAIVAELNVQDEFREYYLQYGGEAFFGSPISPQLVEGGTRTQYFENARLEWHPEAPIEYRVQIGLLGEAHYQRIGLYEDPGRSRPLDSAGVREANISASFRTPILYSGDKQVVFVEVKTPDGHRPVVGVEVELAVKYDGQTELVTLTSTDGAGRTKGPLPLPNFEPGRRVHVTVTASAPGGTLIGSTTESFRTWW
jgi:hypothetical protein